MANPPLRFAHPFFTVTRPELRLPSPEGQRMSEWILRESAPIPAPSRQATLLLEEIIGLPGVQEISTAQSIRFHAVGDTGRKGGNSDVQEGIAQAMTADYEPSAGGRNPAFFLHLGDVIYGSEKVNAYRDEFYRPYKNYPGKIIAVAGNHDGETFSSTDPLPLEAFLQNFCAPQAVVPSIASEVRIFRETMIQPGVYWLLDAPFVQILGLYSNTAEGPGQLMGQNGDTQQLDWLLRTLNSIHTDRQAGIKKALIVAVHHPPYSNGGHAGSPAMLAAIVQACQTAGVVPDAVLSGHAHNYQRYTRHWNVGGQTWEVPFLVAGCGGHGHTPLVPATGQLMGEHTYEKSLSGYGYLTVEVSADRLTIEMKQVAGTQAQLFDSVTVDLHTHQLTAPAGIVAEHRFIHSFIQPFAFQAERATHKLPGNQFGGLIATFDHWTLAAHDGLRADDNHIYLWLRIDSGPLSGKYEVAVNVHSNSPLHHQDPVDQLNLSYYLSSQEINPDSWPIVEFNSQASISYRGLGLSETHFRTVEAGELRDLISSFATTCQRVGAYGVTYPTGDGLHEVHMNSGNRPPRQHEDRLNQDGALVFYFDAQHGGPVARWVFLKFKTQDFPQ